MSLAIRDHTAVRASESVEVVKENTITDQGYCLLCLAAVSVSVRYKQVTTTTAQNNQLTETTSQTSTTVVLEI